MISICLPSDAYQRTEISLTLDVKYLLTAPAHDLGRGVSPSSPGSCSILVSVKCGVEFMSKK